MIAAKPEPLPCGRLYVDMVDNLPGKVQQQEQELIVLWKLLVRIGRPACGLDACAEPFHERFGRCEIIRVTGSRPALDILSQHGVEV